MEIHQVSPQIPLSRPKAVDKKFGATYVFRLRKHNGGPFPNLWELSILDPKGCEKAQVKKLISDADSLVYCLDNMQGQLEDDGL